MRRTNPFAAAIFGAVVALLIVVAFPGLGIGEGEFYSSHGGPPEVYTQTHPDDLCAQLDNSSGTLAVMNQDFTTLEAQSNVTILFMGKTGRQQPREIVAFGFGLDGQGPDAEWGQPAPGSFTQEQWGTSSLATIMWTFDHVEAGDHSVQVFARATGIPLPSVDLNACTMTVLVSPTIAGTT